MTDNPTDADRLIAAVDRLTAAVARLDRNTVQAPTNADAGALEHLRWKTAGAILRELRENGPMAPEELQRAAPEDCRPELTGALEAMQVSGWIAPDASGRWVLR